VRIAVAATPSVAIPTLDALIASVHELAFVITKPDAPAGRGRALQSTPVALWAQSKNIQVLKPESSQALGELVDGLDLVITIGYGLLLPPEVLQRTKYGFINLHFSLLPRWRGAAPVQRAIEAGDKITGVTVFALDPGMDTGPIYQSAQIPISLSDTSTQILDSLANLGVEPVLKTLQQIERGEKATPQEDFGATRAYKLSKEEGQIDWQLDAETILRKINAFNPDPSAWSFFRGQLIKINNARLTEDKTTPGSLKVVDKSIVVGTKTVALELVEVTPAGKSQMLATAWANGARLNPTDSFQ
jgi:methionyl-tRNA formyltransferase